MPGPGPGPDSISWFPTEYPQGMSTSTLLAVVVLVMIVSAVSLGGNKSGDGDEDGESRCETDDALDELIDGARADAGSEPEDIQDDAERSMMGLKSQAGIDLTHIQRSLAENSRQLVDLTAQANSLLETNEKLRTERDELQTVVLQERRVCEQLQRDLQAVITENETLVARITDMANSSPPLSEEAEMGFAIADSAKYRAGDDLVGEMAGLKMEVHELGRVMLDVHDQLQDHGNAREVRARTNNVVPAEATALLLAPTKAPARVTLGSDTSFDTSSPVDLRLLYDEAIANENRLLTQFKAVQEQNESFRSRIQELEQQVATNRHIAQNARQSFTSSPEDSELRELRQMNIEYRALYEEFMTSNEQLTEQVRALQTERADLLRRVDELEPFTSAHQQMAQSVRELSTQLEEIESSTEGGNVPESTQEAEEDERLQLTQRVASMEEDERALQDELSAADEDRDVLMKEIAQLQARVQSVETEMQGMILVNQAKEMELLAAAEKLASDVEDARRQRDDCAREVLRHKAYHEEAMDQLRELAAARDVAEARVSTIEARMEALAWKLVEVTGAAGDEKEKAGKVRMLVGAMSAPGGVGLRSGFETQVDNALADIEAWGEVGRQKAALNEESTSPAESDATLQGSTTTDNHVQEEQPQETAAEPTADHAPPPTTTTILSDTLPPLESPTERAHSLILESGELATSTTTEPTPAPVINTIDAALAAALPPPPTEQERGGELMEEVQELGDGSDVVAEEEGGREVAEEVGAVGGGAVMREEDEGGKDAEEEDDDEDEERGGEDQGEEPTRHPEPRNNKLPTTGSEQLLLPPDVVAMPTVAAAHAAE